MATPEQIAAGVPASANIVGQVAAPGGGTYYLGADGGIFATGGAKYEGGVNNLQNDTLAGKHQFGANALTAGPNGYAVTDTAGHVYNFNPSTIPGPAPNPLAQNDAFNAFMRTSGLSADQYAADYANSVSTAQRVRDTALAELTDPFGQRAKGLNDLAQSYENRGFSGSGQQAKDVTGYNTETGNMAGQDNADYANAVSGAGNTFQQNMGGLAQKGTEQGFTTGSDQAWQQFQQDEAQKHPELSDQIYGSTGTKAPSSS